MTRPRWLIAGILVLVVALGVTGLIFWHARRVPGETSFGGKPLAAWLEALASSDPVQAAATVDTLVNLGPDGLAVLLEARKDADLRIHRRAVAGLIQKGADAAGPLVEALPRGGARVEVALVRLGPAAIPAFESALTRPEAKQAAWMLGDLGERARPAVPALIALLGDLRAPPDSRAAAARALGQIGPEPREVPAPVGGDLILQALTGALSGPPVLRREAALALGRIGFPARAAGSDLVRLCRDPDVEVAIAACQSLAALGTAEAAGPLATRMLGGDGASRAAALALARLGGAARPAVPALITALKSDKDDGLLARAVLERLGGTVLPDLEEALADPDAGRRRGAAEVLGLLGSRATATVPVLVDRLKDPEPTVVPVSQALVRIDPDRAPLVVPVLRKLLAHADDKVVGASALVLGDVGPRARDAIPDLQIIAKGKGPRDKGRTAVRAACVRALGRMGTAARLARADLLGALEEPGLRPLVLVALPRIEPAEQANVNRMLANDLASEDEAVRLGALSAMNASGVVPANVVPVLRPLLQDVRLSRGVLVVLERLDQADLEKVVPDLVTLLSSSDAGVRELAGRLLRQVGTPALPALRAALSRDDPRTRTAIAWTLRAPVFRGRASPPQALIERLEDPDPVVRLAAAEVLGNLGAQGERAIARAIEHLASPEADLRRALVRALGQVEPARVAGVLPHLLECLLDPDEEVRLNVAEILGSWPATQESLAALRDALVDRSPGVRLLAAEGLYRQGGKKTVGEVVPVLLALAQGATVRGRLDILDILERVEAKQAQRLVPLLEADLRGDDVAERTRAAVSLVRIDPLRAPSIVPFLAGVLAGWDAPARQQAALALGQIGAPALPAMPVLRWREQVEEDRDVRDAILQARAAIEPKGSR